MSRLILVRHGQSEWNKKNIFTGWIDIPLSLQGVEEALAAGKSLQNTPIDLIYTSTLIRGIMTAMLIMNVHTSGKVPYLVHRDEKGFEGWQRCYDPDTEASLLPVITAWELNERMYGELQGMNKEAMKKKFGQEQVQQWRRSYDQPPPQGESLKMTADRTLPYFREVILPELKKGKNILISAHGNSLRSIVMFLDQLSVEEVLHLEIPTGKALHYHYENGKVVKS